MQQNEAVRSVRGVRGVPEKEAVGGWCKGGGAMGEEEAEGAVSPAAAGARCKRVGGCMDAGWCVFSSAVQNRRVQC